MAQALQCWQRKIILRFFVSDKGSRLNNNTRRFSTIIILNGKRETHSMDEILTADLIIKKPRYS